MATVLDLDAELAAVLPTDLWYSTSVKLRAEWRIQLTTPEYQPRMFNEATALVDSAIAMFLDVQLYMMRIRATYLAGDIDATLATARSALRLIDIQIDRLEEQPDSAGSQAASLRVWRLDEIESFMSDLAARHNDRAPEIDRIQDTIDSHRERILEL